MKSYKIEKEHGVDYVVIRLGEDDMMIWKKIIKQNFDFLKNPNFKFIISSVGVGDWLIVYMYKYKIHNSFGPAFILIGNEDDTNWYIDGDKLPFEDYVNKIRKGILDKILGDESFKSPDETM